MNVRTKVAAGALLVGGLTLIPIDAKLFKDWRDRRQIAKDAGSE